MMTTFNAMHQQGVGINGSDTDFATSFTNNSNYSGPVYGINFFGDDNTVYEWDNDSHCVVATQLDASAGITRSLTHTTDTYNGKTIYKPVVEVEGNVLTQPDKDGNPVKMIDELKGINIINVMRVNSRLTAPGGTSQVAARTLSVEEKKDNNGKNLGTYGVTINGSADGTNAVNISSLFNLAKENVTTTAQVQYKKDGGTPSKVNMDIRAVGDVSVNAYYTSVMSRLGTDAKSIDTKESAQDDLITQIVNWRSSTSGVDWNEELTNMITFQKGYSACSRCLTTMDEMLDRLINSTGVVGR